MKHRRAFLTDAAQVDTGRLRGIVRISEIAALGTTLGFADGTLRGACPFHAEKTPSFIIDDYAGTYLCDGCGARGDALRLAHLLSKDTFVETCEWLMAHHTRSNPALVLDILRAGELRQAAVACAKRMWREARPLKGSPIHPMLQRMGFGHALAGCIRFEWVSEPATDHGLGQVYPSMTIAFQDVDGSVVGIARHRLAEDFACQINGDSLHLIGQISSATARFGPAASRIVLAPNIGDVPLAMRQHPDETVWAVLQPQDLHDVALPHWVTHVTIFSTGDHIDAVARVAARVSLGASCVKVDVNASC